MTQPICTLSARRFECVYICKIFFLLVPSAELLCCNIVDWMGVGVQCALLACFDVLRNFQMFASTFWFCGEFKVRRAHRRQRDRHADTIEIRTWLQLFHRIDCVYTPTAVQITMRDHIFDSVRWNGVVLPIRFITGSDFKGNLPWWMAVSHRSVAHQTNETEKQRAKDPRKFPITCSSNVIWMAATMRCDAMDHSRIQITVWKNIVRGTSGKTRTSFGPALMPCRIYF